MVLSRASERVVGGDWEVLHDKAVLAEVSLARWFESIHAACYVSRTNRSFVERALAMVSLNPEEGEVVLLIIVVG